jgi:DNA-binding XRE family transcriptional regulator
VQQFYSKSVQCFQDQQAQRGAELATIGAVMPRIDGEKLRDLREERFLSHRELATRAGVSPTTVLNLETNKEVAPQRRTIRKLAQALGVDPAELVE